MYNWLTQQHSPDSTVLVCSYCEAAAHVAAKTNFPTANESFHKVSLVEHQMSSRHVACCKYFGNKCNNPLAATTKRAANIDAATYRMFLLNFTLHRLFAKMNSHSTNMYPDLSKRFALNDKRYQE